MLESARLILACANMPGCLRGWASKGTAIHASLLFVLAIVFIATLVRSAFGFGEALIAVPLLALFMPMNVAAPLAVLLSISVAAMVVVQDWRHIHLRSATGLLVATVFGIPLGLLVLTSSHQEWVKAGLGIFIMGAALTSAEMRLPALAHGAPFATGAVVLIAGATQFTAWKTRQLACCRTAPGSGEAVCGIADAPWRHGVHFGWRCVHCCAGLTATLVVMGVMDLRAMLLVTAAITAERVAAGGPRIARVTGAILVGVGLMLIAQAAHRI